MALGGLLCPLLGFVLRALAPPPGQEGPAFAAAPVGKSSSHRLRNGATARLTPRRRFRALLPGQPHSDGVTPARLCALRTGLSEALC